MGGIPLDRVILAGLFFMVGRVVVYLAVVSLSKGRSRMCLAGCVLLGQ